MNSHQWLCVIAVHRIFDNPTDINLPHKTSQFNILALVHDVPYTIYHIRETNNRSPLTTTSRRPKRKVCCSSTMQWARVQKSARARLRSIIIITVLRSSNWAARVAATAAAAEDERVGGGVDDVAIFVECLTASGGARVQPRNSVNAHPSLIHMSANTLYALFRASPTHKNTKSKPTTIRPQNKPKVAQHKRRNPAKLDQYARHT